MKKILLVFAVALAFCLGIGAASVAQKVTAEICPHFTVIADGEKQTFTDANGTEVYPLVYNGTTYLPVRSIGNLMGKNVGWDSATSTITLNGKFAFDQIKNALMVNGITYKEVKMAAEMIGATEGYKYETAEGNIEVYLIDDTDLLAEVESNGVISSSWGNFPVFINGKYVMLSNSYTQTKIIQNIFNSIK